MFGRVRHPHPNTLPLFDLTAEEIEGTMLRGAFR
jgi:hypothetical protein